MVVRVFIDNRRVAESAYTIPAGASRYITTISSVPEDAKYKARIIIRDALGSNKSVGKFKKKTNCFKEVNTTTTIPRLASPSTTQPLLGPLTIDPLVSTTTTLPGELKITDDVSLISPTTTLGPISSALIRDSSVIVNNKMDENTVVEVEDVSEVQISNDNVSLSIALTCTIACDEEEKESNEFVVKSNSTLFETEIKESVNDDKPAVIKGELDGQITIEASGFEPNSYVEVYMFSEPTFVGLLQTDENGSVSGTLPTPNLDPGIHTLQALGTSTNGDEVVSNVKVELINTDEVAFTNNEGDDYVAWDFNVDDNYVEDADYLVQYYYLEDQKLLANTGFNLNLYGIAGGLSLVFGLFLFTVSRKKRLLNRGTQLDPIYKNTFKLKTQLEKLTKQRVEVLVNFDQINPYSSKSSNWIPKEEIIENLNIELINTLLAVRNISENIAEDGKFISKDEIFNILELITTGKFEVRFLGDLKDNKKNQVNIFDFADDIDDLRETHPRKTKNKKSLNKLSLALSGLLMLTGILFGGYTINEIYLTNIKQENAQQYLEDIYTSSNQVTIDETGIANQSNLINLDRLLKDTPVFETFREMVLPENTNISDKLMPSVFGYLEIPSINLKQYVVTGTNDESLELGPGHYSNTALPGTGGNVGIAGHRTTYGAPFADLNFIALGDDINLIFGSNKYYYKVDNVEVVEAVGGEYVLYSNGEDRLTLTTCHPKYSAKQRLIVSAILIKIETIN